MSQKTADASSGNPSSTNAHLPPMQPARGVLDPDPIARAVKRERLLRVMAEHHLDRVVLSSGPSVNWYLDGARTHVSFAAPPIVSVEVDRHGDCLLMTDNEYGRLIAEELPEDLDVQTRPWWAQPAATGTPEATIASALRALRSNLLPVERERFRQLGATTARAVTVATDGAIATMTERELAGRASDALTAAGVEPLVVLVGGESRAAYRHPLPTDAPLGARAMLVVCARRWGLIANMTRWVRFTDPTPDEADRDERILAVEADAFAATRPGRSLANVLTDIAVAYPRHGFAANEYERHHQGGLAGYDGRDPRATPTAQDLVPPVAYVAWNPSAPGAKVEDTVVIEGGAVTPLTIDPRWPAVTVAGVPRPSVRQL